jgi:hypothetical protein
MAGSRHCGHTFPKPQACKTQKTSRITKEQSRNNALLNQIRDSAGEPAFAKAHLSHPTEQVARRV